LGFRVRKFEFFFSKLILFLKHKTIPGLDRPSILDTPQVKLSGRDPSAHQWVLNPQPFSGPRVPDKGCDHLAITPWELEAEL
jgi:hypothetical protein